MSEIKIRKMTFEDIPFICKADHDESEAFVEYLNNNLNNQKDHKCSAFLALLDDQVAPGWCRCIL
ncbi:MAG: hypothetical protein J5825_07420 [Lachnospiraceae bacterium]|nr:hypothetical protein [Lachnospiraceae bacterium]